jgi:hypothetical protein
MKFFTRIILFAGLTLTATAYGQAPKYSNEFLSIGVGARALGMSNSCVAGVNDVTAGYWNPAGLSQMTGKVQVGLMHAEYFAGIAKYDYGSIAARIDSNSVAGISVIRFGVDDIPNTTELIDNNGNVNYDNVQSFSAADYAFILSYARQNKKIAGLRYGANAKIINRKVGKFANAWGFGIDIGAQYNVKNWHFGASYRDATTTFNAWRFNIPDEMRDVFASTGNTIPSNSVEKTLPRLILAAGYKWNIKKFSVYTEANFNITTDGRRNVAIKSDPFSIDPTVGLELGYGNFIFLRAGIGNIQKYTDDNGKQVTSVQPNMGLGIKLRSICIDYALTDIGNASVAPYSNVFSLRFDINAKSGSKK